MPQSCTIGRLPAAAVTRTRHATTHTALYLQADVSDSTYNAALDAFVGADRASASSAPGRLLKAAEAAVAAQVPGATLPLLAMQLATRQQSPRLEVFRQLAQQWLPPDVSAAQCCALDLEGHHVVDSAKVPVEVQTWLSKQERTGTAPGTNASAAGVAAATAEIDHVYLRSAAQRSGSGQVHRAVLYGPPGVPCFAAMHAAAKQALLQSQQHIVDYVVRPVLLPGCQASQDAAAAATADLAPSSSPSLSAYGVQLVMKNLEYSQSDDVHAATRNATDTGEPDAIAAASKGKADLWSAAGVPCCSLSCTVRC